MTDIAVTPLEPGVYGVEIVEGHERTGHRVAVPEGLVDELVGPAADVEGERIVREAVGFLLERQPATAIPAEISLDEVADAFADFGEDLRQRLA
jgi:hypothetical protein